MWKTDFDWSERQGEDIGERQVEIRRQRMPTLAVFKRKRGLVSIESSKACNNERKIIKCFGVQHHPQYVLSIANILKQI